MMLINLCFLDNKYTINHFQAKIIFLIIADAF